MLSTCKFLIIGLALVIAVMAIAQTQHQKEWLSVEGYAGEANVIRYHGRVFVDAQDLAQVTNGSLRFAEGQIVLTLHEAEPTEGEADKAAFSRPFMKAAIEAMASIREWGGTLQATVQNGYPVAKTAAGYTINAYQGRAQDSIAFAASAASNDADRRGLALLKNEFNSVQEWSNAFVSARSSLSAVDLTTSEDALKNDEEAQKLVRCGQFLAQMFGGGTFQDDPACH